MRKNEAMYSLFGKADGKCRDCCHLKGGVNEYRKCRIYGVSASEATDWVLSWQACGLFNKDSPYDVPIVNLNKGGRKAEEVQIPGQMSFL